MLSTRLLFLLLHSILSRPVPSSRAVRAAFAFAATLPSVATLPFMVRTSVGAVLSRRTLRMLMGLGSQRAGQLHTIQLRRGRL